MAAGVRGVSGLQHDVAAGVRPAAGTGRDAPRGRGLPGVRAGIARPHPHKRHRGPPQRHDPFTAVPLTRRLRQHRQGSGSHRTHGSFTGPPVLRDSPTHAQLALSAPLS